AVPLRGEHGSHLVRRESPESGGGGVSAGGSAIRRAGSSVREPMAAGSAWRCHPAAACHTRLGPLSCAHCPPRSPRAWPLPRREVRAMHTRRTARRTRRTAPPISCRVAPVPFASSCHVSLAPPGWLGQQRDDGGGQLVPPLARRGAEGDDLFLVEPERAHQRRGAR